MNLTPGTWHLKAEWKKKTCKDLLWIFPRVAENVIWIYPTHNLGYYVSLCDNFTFLSLVSLKKEDRCVYVGGLAASPHTWIAFSLTNFIHWPISTTCKIIKMLRFQRTHENQWVEETKTDVSNEEKRDKNSSLSILAMVNYMINYSLCSFPAQQGLIRREDLGEKQSVTSKENFFFFLFPLISIR